MSDLVERVAAAIAATPEPGAEVRPWHRKQARAAISVVMEEAARMAEDAGDYIYGGDLADEYRALIEKAVEP